ncbi:Radical SAM [Sulfurimonas denitrificans DSM 1251]|uniref:Radical SAM n=1 Tax=Sulfurimonas denitrificans (strain ATCC 33889 / DSM 1251) TaxID=326298 RepID=Q30U53_SULDN|nr:radical SAM/SPASM domain-containing protein [Sulfurimonas denitrificans]ABB43478.1 Radical SAM [Sulfurimonas denitrificans DSM 1251]
MSYVNNKNLIYKFYSTRSLKGFAKNFLLKSMAGQKMFLYNKNIPRVINISFNEHTCMFKCKICPYSQNEVADMYKQKKEMSFETLKNIVSSVPNDSFYSFDISSIGETLEFKNLAKFISYMKEQKPLVNTIISTNGLLLNEKIARDLIKSGLDNIQFSLFAGDEDGHKFVTQSDSFTKVKKNIINFKKIKDSLGSKTPFTQTFMIETKENKHLSNSFVEKWSSFVDKAFIRHMYKMGHPIDGMTPSYEDENHKKERYPCVAPWYSTSIISNGDVLGCYMFNWHAKEKESMVIGNINKNTLSEIYTSKNNQDFRDNQLDLNFKSCEACKDCNLWDAYTNIWEKDSKSYKYSSLKVFDFFNTKLEYRGG